MKETHLICGVIALQQRLCPAASVPSPPPPTNGTNGVIRWHNGVLSQDRSFRFVATSPTPPLDDLRWQQRDLQDGNELRDLQLLVRLGDRVGYGQVMGFENCRS